MLDVGTYSRAAFWATWVAFFVAEAARFVDTSSGASSSLSSFSARPGLLGAKVSLVSTASIESSTTGSWSCAGVCACALVAVFAFFFRAFGLAAVGEELGAAWSLACSKAAFMRRVCGAMSRVKACWRRL